MERCVHTENGRVEDFGVAGRSRNSPATIATVYVDWNVCSACCRAHITLHLSLSLCASLTQSLLGPSVVLITLRLLSLPLLEKKGRAGAEAVAAVAAVLYNSQV